MSLPELPTAPVSPKTSKWEEVSLSTRLITTFVMLLSFGLFVAFIVTSTLLRSSLVAQLDHHLATTADTLSGAPEQWLGETDKLRNSLPSSFYIQLDLVDGRSAVEIHPGTKAEFGLPDLSSTTAVPSDPHQAFTVSNTSRGGPWRVYRVPVVSQSTGAEIGVLSVALPTATVLRPLEDSIGLLIATSLVLLMVGGLMSWVAVRRTLSPLRQIESIAGAISRGDLSRRIPAYPPSTELGSLARSLNTMLSQIEDAFADRSASVLRTQQFISDASHELRTPVATIRGYAELYRMGGIPAEEVPQAMQRIETEAARMGMLVADLLQLARLDEGRQLVKEVVDLAALARDAAQDLRVLDQERHVAVVSLSEDQAVAPTWTFADPDKIRQLLANLVGNIQQHTPTGSPVEFAVGYGHECAVVEVRDHGPGVPPEEAAQIFRRFYRVDTSRARSSGGSGLGLAIVAAIVEAHQGDIAVRTTPGGGLTIRVELAQAHPPQPQKDSLH